MSKNPNTELAEDILRTQDAKIHFAKNLNKELSLYLNDHLLISAKVGVFEKCTPSKKEMFMRACTHIHAHIRTRTQRLEHIHI